MKYPDTLGKIDRLSVEKQELLRRMLAKKGMDTFALPIPLAHGRDLSFAQKRLWFLHGLGLTQAYNMVNALVLDGAVDVSALSRAYMRLQERHEILRTRIVTRGGSPQPEVDPLPNAPLSVIEDEKASLEAVVDTIVAAEHNRIFDLENGPLMHVTLAKAPSSQWVLVVNIHHILSDLWSMGVIINEISALYSAYTREEEADLPALSIQYNDYAVWQKSYLEGPSGAQQLSFWKNELASVPPHLDLPLDFSRPAKQTHSGAMVPIHISEDVVSGLRANARKIGATDFMIFLGIYQWLLADFSGQNDLVIGTPVAGRRKPELEPLIGMFVNTLALRTQIDSDQSFEAHLQNIKDKTLAAFSNQDLPFEGIVQAIQPERDLSYSPIFQVMFILQNLPTSEIQLQGLRLSPARGQIVDAKFDLTLTLSMAEQGYSGSFVYNKDLFQKGTIQKMAEHYQHLLGQAVTMPCQPKRGLVISEASRSFLSIWNAEVDADYVSTLPSLMNRRALANPNAPALVMDGADGQLSHGELHQKAAELAHRLRQVGVGKDTPVGVCMYRSHAMPLGLLAIWKAGGAYVPLDPEYPAERLRLMMAETGISIILTEKGALAAAEALGETILVDPFAVMSSSSFEDDPLPNQLAYMLFTSGSTGKPKGTMMDHRAICNRLDWMQRAYALNQKDRVLQKTPYSFDVSVWEFFWPMMVGAALVIGRPGGHKDPIYLTDLIQRQGITTLHFVPSMLAAFLDGLVEEKPWRLQVFSSGEALSAQLVQRYFLLLPQSRLHNLYGPTEAAVDVSYHACVPDYGQGPVPIGRPIHNINLWVVNAQLQLVTPGARGRLFIGGIGLARGYCGAPAQTATRFLPDPFAQTAGSRIYDTGDLVRHREQGESLMELEYLGRADFQVKLRGFRIEIEEIENTLLAVPGIRDVAVTIRQLAGDQQLIAYFVEEQSERTASELRNFLLERLPEFMIPALFLAVDQIPLNANGKKDRSALPDPLDLVGDTEGNATKTATEGIIAGIWEQLLGRTNPGRTAHFFQMGGHSLLATRMLNRVRKSFQIQLPLETIFQYPRLHDFAEVIERARATHAVTLPAPQVAIRPEVLPLSAAQRRMWFLERLHGPGSDYNMPLALSLKGPLDVVRLHQAVAALMDRHEILRTRFGSHNGEPYQIIDAEVPLSTVLHLVTLDSNKEVVKRHFSQWAHQPFDLETGPLWQVYSCSLGSDSHYILMVSHHIISDGWSTGILLRDLVALYGNEPALPLLPIQYADYTCWTLSDPYREKVSREMDYWSVQLAGCEKPVLLETDFPRNSSRGKGSATCSFSLNEASSKALETYAKASNSTMFMTTLGAYGLLLSRYTGSDDLTIGTPIAGRTHANLENMIGLFLNSLVLRMDLSGDITFDQLLERVRHMSLHAFEHQHAPFDLLVEKLLPNRRLEHSPLFQVMFVFQNFEIPQMQMGDLEASSFALQEQSAARSDLDFYLYETPAGLRGRFVYNADLFLPSTIDTFSRRMTHVVERIAEGFEQSIHLLPLQRDMVLYGEKLFHDAQQTWAEQEVPLSAHQQRLWFIDRFEKGSLYEASPVYHNMPFLMRISGDFDTALLEQSLTELIKQNAILRSNIITRNGQGFLVLHRPWQETVTVREVPFIEKHSYIMEDVLRPFDLAEDHLLRAYVYQGGRENLLMLNVHHILMDRMSLNLLARELAKIYRNMASGQYQLEAAAGIDYLSFIQAQQGFTDQSLEPQWFYWKRRLKGKLQPLELPQDRPRPALHTFTTASLHFPLTEHLAPLNQSQAVYEYLLTAFLCILRRYSGQDEIVVGNSMPCRLNEPLANMMGPLANLTVLRAFFSGETTYEEMLAEVRTQITGAKAHQELPFDLLVQKLNPEKDMSRTALFDVLFQWEEIDTNFDLGADLKGEGLPCGLGHGKNDLTLTITRRGDAFDAILVYNADFFDPTSADALARHYLQLLTASLTDPTLEVDAIGLLSEEEKQVQLVSFNQTEATYPENATLVDLFEQQVEQNPHAQALVYQGTQITYGQLEADSNRLAHHLRLRGVRPGQLVGLCLERTPLMITAIIATMKAGAVYVPMDITYPDERIGYMCCDAALTIVITQQEKATFFAHLDGVILDGDQTWRRGPDTRLDHSNTPDSRVYCIYTSGSLGRPKGVLLSHRNVVRLFFNSTDKFDFHQGDVWTLFHSYCFDFSVWEMYGALLFGGKLVIVPEDVARDQTLFANLLATEKPTILNQTPSAFSVLSRLMLEAADRYSSIRMVIFGGEALDPSQLLNFRKAFAQIQLINMYGITETCVHVTYQLLEQRHLERGISDIGGPIPTTTLYVLDPKLELQPIGYRGQLFVGGLGLAHGYLNRKSLTAQRFIPNHLSSVPGDRLYCTGDLARLQNNGKMQYLGRIDHQVKIRGFRIELGEIENVLAQTEGVAQAAVLARDSVQGLKILVAYVVGKDLNTDLLRTSLAKMLPPHMVPAFFVEMSAMPLTTNGKLDRDALPLPEIQSAQEDRHEAPETKTEHRVAAIFAEVLELERVGRQANFFESGGHSLLATLVISRIRNLFGLELEIRVLFEAPTVQALAERIDQADPEAATPTEIKAVSRDQVLPLSFSQQRLWFLQRLQGQSSAYHVPSIVRLQGSLNIECFNRAVVAMQERQEVLRTTFAEKDGQPYMVFNEPLVRQVNHLQHPWAGDTDTPLPDSLRQSLRAMVEEPFDMEKGPLFRVVLIQLGPQDFLLLMVLHHIISDGWTTGVLISDLAELYRAFCNNQSPELERLPYQYADYAYWQRQRLDEQVLGQLTTYWKAKLAGIAPLLELPTDKVRPTIQGHRGGTVPFTLDAHATLALRQLCAQEEVTLFMALISGFAIVLSRYSGTTDIPIGTVFANRGLAGMERLLGFFVNTLVLRNQIETDKGIRPLLSRVKATTLDAFKHQDMPFERLVEVIQPSRSLSHSPLFQVVLMLQNMPSASPDLGNLRVTKLPGSGTTAKFDLTYSIFETDSGLEGQLEYNLDLYERESVVAISEHFANILVSMTEASETPVSHLLMLSEWERTRAMVIWNATEQTFPHRVMHEMFDAHALGNPDRTALIHEGQTYSYGQLRQAALIISQHLVEKGARPNKLVAVVIDKSFHQIAAVFGVLYAGAAYLPVEPGWPAKRREAILELGEVDHVLTSANTATGEQWPNGIERIYLNELLAQDHKVDEQPTLRQTEQDLAYVIFTSGSTGVPKGVVIEHFAIVNTLFDINHRFDIDDQDVILGLSSLCFDLSVYDIFGALGTGARLVIPDRDSERDPAHWVSLMENYGVTVWNTVPALMQMLVDEVAYQKHYGLDSLRLALLSGDWIPVGLPNQARGYFSNLVMFSLGGATEGSIWSIFYPITDVDPNWRSIPYGKPLANQKFFVFDRALQPCPVRVLGELYIGGKGVALEYWRNPDKSAEHFSKHPVTGEKIYRTGDLGRYLPDGTIEFMGRADFQVKLNGYRIELGDVESALKQFEGVSDAVCTIRADSRGVRKLLAYVLGEQGHVPDGETLRHGLRELLPDYMIPAAVTLMDSLPLTPNGKVDRDALQDPVIAETDEESFVAPRTELEMGLAKIWRELLLLERVGIHDNFFKIGGDSIISMQLISRAKPLGLQLSPRLIFENQTIAELVEAVDGKPMVEAEQGIVLGEAPLHPIQRWFFDHIQVDQHHFNQKILLASQEKLDPELLQRVFDRLLSHHDSLRLNIVGAEHGRKLVFRTPEEMIDAFVVQDLTHISDPSTTIRDLATREQASFQLERGSLAKLVLFSTAASEPDRLLFLAHHLVVDGVSWRILLEDLDLLYRGFKAGHDPKLHAKTTSFRHWGKKLQDYAQSDELPEKAAFWQRMVDLPAPTLPRERDGANLVGLTGTLSFMLEADETRLLLQDASTAYNTEVNDLLLSALLLGFNQWTGQTSLKLTMEGHGRSDLFSDVDLSRTVGWFTCMFPVSLRFKDDDGLGELITAVKETMRSIPDGGLSYGILQYLTDHACKPPQAEVVFNYLGQFDQMLPPEATFRVASDSAGSDHSPAQQRPWLLEITALVADGRLRVAMTYAKDIFDREQLETLQECYHSALLTVIEQCVNHEASLTRSDVDVAFEAEEFDDLLSELRDLDDYLEE